ncbi:MAG: hypothetical protein LBQ13_04670 [Endomicrobium sp.]|jgi:hypothetical protein|nr:hypothetical protein [Endomicrobium sp.]
MMEKLTSVKISSTAQELIKQIKVKYHYTRMNDAIVDMCHYFLNYDQSPRDAKAPISELFKKFADRLFGAFNKNHKEVLQPFIKDSYEFYNKFIDTFDTGNTQKNAASQDEKIYDRGEVLPYLGVEEKKLKELILDLDRLKVPFSDSSGGACYKISIIDYNKIMDKIKMM